MSPRTAAALAALTTALAAAAQAPPLLVHDAGPNAFGLPSPALTAAQRRDFMVGNSFFKQNWVTSGASATGRAGLGPLFNARSCSSCHLRDGRSAPPGPGDVERSGLLVRIGVRAADASDAPHPVYGAQIQDAAVPGARAEARVDVRHEEIPGRYGDGEPFTLQRPLLALHELGYGPLGDGVVLGARVAPHLVGLGLLEAVDPAQLHAHADPDDRDADGVSGRVARLDDGSIGRFGWKATQPTVRAQTAAAFANDMGITSPVLPREVLTAPQREHFAAMPFANDGVAEIAAATFDRVVWYTATLAVPAPRDQDDATVAAGRAHFTAFGCAACHVPSLVTGDDALHPAFARATIAPYTDLLLHDLGDGLADGKHDGAAGPREWRTPPLWGLGLVPTVNGHTRLLHDGRARGFAEAVLWHGGEAHAARERFRLAPASERAALLAFLRSL